MIFPDVTYSVLIVSSAEKFNTSIESMLSPNFYYPVDFAKSVGSAKRILTEKSFDFVIVNSPLTDDSGCEFVCDICEKKNSAVLILAKADVFETVNDQVSRSGVFALSKPTNAFMIETALKWMTATRERLRRFEKKSLTMEEKMVEIRLINRAKWLLIENLSMSENDAHKYIEKQAMDRCVSKREIAEKIISTYS